MLVILFAALLLVNAVLVSAGSVPQPSAANCTWKYVTQPLSHFERGNADYYQQRLCVYDGYYKPNQSLPIFFYTGNESPVEEYVNNTGLMWTLAEKMNALIIFAEHRYFGKSVPKIHGTKNCVAYLTSEEALADYATLTNVIRRDEQTWGAKDSAIIAFGGSYGGMLASWMRTLYPSAIDGAIAASAPIWGFPLNTCPLDASARVVSYATSQDAGSGAYCSSNLKSSYVLLSDIGKTTWGRTLLSEQLNLCSPLNSAADLSLLLNYLQTPLFDLAEGSYPFASNYITFALTGSSDAMLPPWAMNVMCQPLDKDFGVSIAGSEETVKFVVADKQNKVNVNVDWDQTTNNQYNQDDVLQSGVLDLLASTLKGIQVWYNVSGDQPTCIDWKGAMAKSQLKSSLISGPRIPGKAQPVFPTASLAVSSSVDGPNKDDNNTCFAPDSLFETGIAWNILTCNEGMNLVNWRAQGVGNDKIYWPPNKPRDFSRDSEIRGSMAYCASFKGMGLYGLPTKPDEWSLWLDTAYGGTRNMYTSNIVYSNGDLDPWMPAGVDMDVSGKKKVKQNDNIVSVLIKQGGHHLDLFWPTDQDPSSVREVRDLEESKIREWISQRVTKMSG